MNRESKKGSGRANGSRTTNRRSRIRREPGSAPGWRRSHLGARLEKESSWRLVGKGVISAPGWKRTHLGARWEKVVSQRPVEKGYLRMRFSALPKYILRKSFILLYIKIMTV